VILARLADDGSGSRLHGRAGFDLGSLGLIGVIAGVVIFSMYQLMLQSMDPALLLLFSAIFLLIPGAVLWLRLVSPEDPAPLVQFIRRVSEPPTPRPAQAIASQFDRAQVQLAKLNINGHRLAAPSEYDVARAILAMEPDGFLIIDFGSNRFMQAALQYDRFILEKCEGSDEVLFRAEGDFDKNDVIAVMTAYLRRSQSSVPIVWEMEQG
jgi:hypothetical protein